MPMRANALVLSRSSFPNNLPAPLTSFVGRERELAEVKLLLTEHRLLTLAGTGGSGKTRLAVQAAAQILDRFPDGVWMAELAALTDPALVPAAVAQATGLRADPDRPLPAVICQWLHTKQALLLIDNCEHLIEPCARLAEALLRGCPGLKIVTTSREPLRVPGEAVLTVPPLSVPDAKGTPVPERLLECESVRLFASRAAAVLPAFRVTQKNAGAVAQICRRLDGLPLALELAAARVRVLSPEQIAARLDDRFAWLNQGSRTADLRQQTLRATIDWSYELLTEPERAMWLRLAVFVGGFGLDAVEAVCADGGIEPSAALDLLSQLVDKSLVAVIPGPGEQRYRLLETIRLYGRDKQQEAEDVAALSQRHFDFYLRLAEAADTGLQSAEQAGWLRRLEQENDDLRAALQWAFASGEPTAGLRLAALLCRFWQTAGHVLEGRMWMERALSGAPDPTPLRARALRLAGVLALVQGDHHGARPLFDESLQICRPLGDLAGVTAALNNLGLLAQYQGEYDRAMSLLTESLTIRRNQGDRGGVARVLNNLAMTVTMKGDYAQAEAYTRESLALKRELGDRHGIANSLNNLGMIARLRGDFDQAMAMGRQALSVWKELGEKRGIATTLATLGAAEKGRGNFGPASALLREALVLFQEVADQAGIAENIEALAQLTAVQGCAERSVRLFGAAEAIREENGTRLAPAEATEHVRALSSAARSLPPAVYAAEWAGGRALPLEQAVALALEEISPAAPAGADSMSASGLTPRELQVVRLAAEGLGDREIAAQLVISPRTVDNHLRNIFSKLQISSRAALVAWAFRRGVMQD